MKKRICSMLLVLCLIMTMLPTMVLAADSEEGTQEHPWDISAEGEGNDVKAYLKQNDNSLTYTLTISGTGATADYSSEKDQPWDGFRSSITAVEISEGITHIGAHSLRQLTAINSELEIPGSLSSIGNCALYMSSFTGFAVSAGNDYFSSDESGVLYNKAQTILYTYPIGSSTENYTAPKTVNKIGSYAFSSAKNLKVANFREATSLSSIGQQAFESATNLNATFKSDADLTVNYEALKGLSSATLECGTLKLAPYALKDTQYIDLTNVTDVDTALSGWWGTSPTFTKGGTNANIIAGAKRVYVRGESVATILSSLPIRDKSTLPPDIAVIGEGDFAKHENICTSTLPPLSKEGFKFSGWDNGAEYQITTIKNNDQLSAKIYRAKWHKTAELTTNIDKKTFVAGGDWAEFTFTTTANDDVGTMVTGGSDFGVLYEDKIAALEYKAGDQWINMKGQNFGGSAGFPMADATSTFRVKFTDDAAGTYSFKAAMTTVDGNQKLCEIEVPFVVNMQTQAAPVNAPTQKDRTYTSITLKTVEPNSNGAAAQYSKDGGKTWQDSAEFTDLTSNTTYTFAVRYAEKAPYAASAASATAEFSTLYRSSGGSSSSGSNYTVSAPSAKNGDVTVSPKNAKKGDTVTITVTPDKGYELDTITVKDASGNKLKLTDKGNGKYTFTMPASKVTVSAEFVEEQAASTFADVPADAYYAKAVEWAVKNGITNGKDNGLFGSNDPCTRGQIVTFLWRAAGSPAPKGTATVPADVLPGSYSYNAVAWALENGITNGMADGTFGVNNTCTRGQSVTFLYRALGTAPSTVNGFTDVAADSFCAGAVAWAVENGVTNGTSATTFSPADGCTRAQIVTFLYRAYQGK